MKNIVKNIVGIASIFLLAMSLASCGSTKEVDYAAELKLTEDYEGRNFITEGIGEERLVYCFDGDTIKTSSGTIRFLAVDTPESTSNVDKWGKSASYFTKGKLMEAEKIVLESKNVGSRAEQENNGRYLAFVWYIPKGASEFRNLNLELVQEGFSEFQSTDKYASYFQKAAEQAAKLKKRVHGNDEDPNYTNEILETNLKYIQEQLKTDPTNVLGTKVGFEAFVTGYKPGNKLNLRQVVDGVEYNMDLYVGHKTGPYAMIGNKVRYVGYVQEFPEGSEQFQISGLIIADTNPAGTYTEVTHEGYYVQVGEKYFPNAKGEVNNALYDNFTISNVSVNGKELVITGVAKRRGLEDRGLEAKRTITIKVPLKDGEENSFKNGNIINFVGFTESPIKYTTDNFVVNVAQLSDITLVK